MVKAHKINMQFINARAMNGRETETMCSIRSQVATAF